MSILAKGPALSSRKWQQCSRRKLFARKRDVRIIFHKQVDIKTSAQILWHSPSCKEERFINKEIITDVRMLAPSDGEGR
jgi:hypothetical protein